MHPITSYLRTLIRLKKSTLCVSADITSAEEMLALAYAVGPHIVVFKTHADILSGWDPDPDHGTGAQLAAIARQFRFLIFEDRKFADIGSTAQLQYAGGDYRILEWAHIVNAHVISGPDMVRALKETANTWKMPTEDTFKAVNLGKSALKRKGVAVKAPTHTREELADLEALPTPKRGLLLLAQMSSAGNLLNAEYTSACLAIARQHQDFVMGFIALEPLNSDPGDEFLVMTPGCSLPPDQSLDDSEFVPGTEDALGQQYVTPQDLMLKGCDIIIVGRGICNAAEPSMKADQYRKVAWEAYQKRLGLTEE
ncbi:Orotidine 5'-phosphate decarboxylase [Lachnellula suecica]|uniref:Orotidine 5'-phosphate decarboxylase n=1 Tax=Lachnellula suecica TaxID=602035 RepID=A0A8T9CQ61_9HELO|nr:Orotidine 5'-phosphate decarboxylase [Lachnellula suecica]